MIRSVVIDRSANPLVVGPVIPVEVMTAAQAAGMPIVGKPMRVIRATNADMIAMKYKSVGMRPVPIVVSTETSNIVDGPVQPVYVLSGILDSLEYTNKMAALGFLEYYPMAEFNGLVATDESGNSRNGIYSGVSLNQTGIGDGRTSASFNGTSSFCNIFSSSFNVAYNGGEFTIEGWAQVANAGVWTDATSRCLVRIRKSGSADRIDIVRSTLNNELDFIYVANGVTKSAAAISFSPTAFFHVAVTVSATADQLKAYINGSQIGVTVTGLGAWSGTLDSTQCCLGSVSTLGNTVWNGKMAHWGIANRAFSAAEIASAATIYVP